MQAKHCISKTMRFFYFSFLFSCCLLFSQLTYAQTQPDTIKWVKSGAATFNFSNVGLSDWAAGGQNAISIGGLIDFKAKRNTLKSLWSSNVHLALGAAQMGRRGENLFKKTDDQLIASSAYSYKMNQNWSFGVGLEGRTQLLAGYLFSRDASGKEKRGQLISNIMAVGYIGTNIFGAIYTNKGTTVAISPTFGKLTTVLNDSLSNAGAFGVKKGKKIRAEIGLNTNIKLDYDLAENINFKTNANFFSAYDPYFIKRIDVNWETLLTLKVNKYISTTFGTQMIYDQDILIKQEDGTNTLAVQFKHVLNVNFSCKFENKKEIPLKN